MTHKQHLLRFSLPAGKRFYINDFREALARTNTLPPAFFANDPETSLPICEAPRMTARNLENEEAREKKAARLASLTAEQKRNPDAIPGVRIVGGTSWVGVLADSHHKALLDAAVVPAIEIVSSVCKAPVPVEMMAYDHSIEALEYPVAYHLREVVLKKGTQRDMPEDEQNEVLKRRIARGLFAQARLYGLDCPTDEQLGIQIAEVIRPRGLQIVTTSGVSKQFAALMDVRFFAHAKLNGFWFVGNLSSRGYGRVISGDYRKAYSEDQA